MGKQLVAVGIGIAFLAGLLARGGTEAGAADKGDGPMV